jgi:hypothetical protein
MCLRYWILSKESSMILMKKHGDYFELVCFLIKLRPNHRFLLLIKIKKIGEMNNNCNEKIVWKHYTKKIIVNKTLDCEPWKYFWEYDCIILLVSKKKNWIKFGPTIWQPFQGQFFLKTNNNNIMSSLDLLRSLSSIRSQKSKEDILFYCRFGFLNFWK